MLVAVRPHRHCRRTSGFAPSRVATHASASSNHATDGTSFATLPPSPPWHARRSLAAAPVLLEPTKAAPRVFALGRHCNRSTVHAPAPVPRLPPRWVEMGVGHRSAHGRRPPGALRGATAPSRSRPEPTPRRGPRRRCRCRRQSAPPAAAPSPRPLPRAGEPPAAASPPPWCAETIRPPQTRRAARCRRAPPSSRAPHATLGAGRLAGRGCRRDRPGDAARARYHNLREGGEHA